MLELWGRKNANQVIQVLWTLSELRVEYKRHSIGTKAGDLETEEYRSLNPNSKIPTIRDNGFVMWESHAVIRYLARHYGLGSLYPKDPQKAAISDQWMTWSTDSFMGTFFPVFWQMVRTEEKDRDYAKIAEMAQQSADILKVLDDHLVSNHFVAGDQFTFGDIPLGVLLHKYFVLDIKRPSLSGIEAWYERLKERPAFREHAMQPFGNSPSEFFDLQTRGEQNS